MINNKFPNDSKVKTIEMNMDMKYISNVLTIIYEMNKNLEIKKSYTFIFYNYERYKKASDPLIISQDNNGNEEWTAFDNLNMYHGCKLNFIHVGKLDDMPRTMISCHTDGVFLFDYEEKYKASLAEIMPCIMSGGFILNVGSLPC